MKFCAFCVFWDPARPLKIVEELVFSLGHSTVVNQSIRVYMGSRSIFVSVLHTVYTYCIIFRYDCVVQNDLTLLLVLHMVVRHYISVRNSSEPGTTHGVTIVLVAP